MKEPDNVPWWAALLPIVIVVCIFVGYFTYHAGYSDGVRDQYRVDCTAITLGISDCQGNG